MQWEAHAIINFYDDINDIIVSIAYSYLISKVKYNYFFIISINFRVI